MAKEKKESQSVTIRMQKELSDKLTEFCGKSGQSKTVAIERAVQRYITDYYKI